MTNIFKILTRKEFEAALGAGAFRGAAIDLCDGYIHFSAASQLHETARRHFAEQQDLMVMAVDSAKLGDALKWEPSRGGQLFPHLYAPLGMADILWAKLLPWNGTVHVFPNEINVNEINVNEIKVAGPQELRKG